MARGSKQWYVFYSSKNSDAKKLGDKQFNMGYSRDENAQRN